MAQEPVAISASTSYMNHIKSLLARGVYIDEIGSRGTLLHNAVEFGFEPAIDFLLKKGAKVNIRCTGYDHTTPLHMALSQRKLELAYKLINQGANLESEDDNGRTMLHHAVINNFQSAVDLMLLKGVRVNVTDNYGNTPLHYNRLIKIAKKLLDRGANIDIENDKGRTPLIQAVRKNFGSIKFLLKEGANVNVMDNDRNSALHFCSSPKTAKRLLFRGANVNHKNNIKETALHQRVLDNGPISVIKVLLNRGANINSRNRLGSTPLQMAIAREYPKIVKLLVKNGANTELPDASGKTPFERALSLRHFKEIRSMFSSKAKVDFKDKKSDYPLHFFLSIRNIVFVKELVTGGAQLECRSGKKQTPLHIAVLRNFRLGVQYLLENGSQVNVKDKWSRTPLHYAVLSKNNNLVKILIAKGPNTNIEDEDGFTALHYAVMTKNLMSVKQIIETGADLDYKDFNGQTALHLAIKTEFIPIVNLLLAKGADINVIDAEGQTPLHLSTESSNLVKILLDNGALIDIQDANGKTPLHLAVEDSAHSISTAIRILINRGAYLDIRDINDRTPLSIAATQARDMFHTYSLQIIKLKVACLDIDETDELISMFLESCHDSHEFENECREEMARMKATRIGNHRLSDVFYKYRNPTFVMEPLIEEAVGSTKLSSKYPEYATLLKVTFDRAMERHLVMDRAQLRFTVSTNNTVKNVDLPDEVKRHIMSFLSDMDLRNILIANIDVENVGNEWDVWDV